MVQPLCVKNNQGFIVLTSFLLILAIGVAVILHIYLSGIDYGRSSLSLEKSAQAKNLANACAEDALAQIKYNNSFTGTISVTMGQGNCLATIANGGGGVRNISVQASVGSIIRNINISTSAINPITVSSWQEN